MVDFGFNPGSVIEERIDNRIDGIRTILPGVISKTNREKMAVDVYIKTVVGENPVKIEGVRVLYPQSRTDKILFNIEKGDTILLLFSKYSLLCLQNDQFINVRKDNRFKLNDVVAIPGIHLDNNLRDESEYSSINGEDIQIPEGMKILSESDLLVSGDKVFIQDIEELKFSDGTTLTTGATTSTFTGLTDTPEDYVDQSGKVVAVNSEEDGLEFSDSGGGVTDHGELSGLSDDDHTQYLHTDGRRGLTGDLDLGNNKLLDVDSIDGDGDYIALEDGLSLTSGSDISDGVGTLYDGTNEYILSSRLDHNSTTLNATSPIEIDTTALELGASATISLNESQVDHGALGGLGDDDHTQYLLIDGTRAMTGSLDMGDKSIDNINTIDGGGSAISILDDVDINDNILDWSSGKSFPNIIEQDSEPNITTGEWTVWYDTNDSQLWLIVNYDGDNKKVELW